MAKLVASQKSAKSAKKSQKLKKVSAAEVEAQSAAAVAHDNAAQASAVPGVRSAIADEDSGGGGGGGGSAALPILGGLAVAGGVAAFALGGGEKNVAPTLASTQTVAGTEDTASSITIAATDANKNDTLTYTVSTPANGTAAVSGNVVTYTPKANFNGTDTFTVTVTDSKGLTATQAVTVNVAAVNDRPVFADAAKALTVNEDTAGTVAVAATDVDGDALTYTAGAAANGTVTVSGGAVSYTPKANFNGTDSFVVTASDGKGGTATQTINVTVAPVNDAPTFATASQAVSTDEDTAKSVTLAATDVDGDVLTYTAGTAANGTVTVSGSTVTYTPKPNFNGTDSFVVTASDGKGGTSTQTINMTVAPVNDAPVISAAATRSIEIDEDGSAKFIIEATDVDDPDSALRATIVSGPANGTLSANTAGDNIYTPKANFNGTDSFVIGISDGKTRTDYTVTVNVKPVNDAPVATFTTAQSATEDGAAVTGQLTSTDVDTGATATYALVGDAIAGLTLNSNGSWSFDPTNAAYQSLAAGATQPITVTYRVTDDKGATATNSFVLTVTGTNDLPVFGSASQSTTTTEDSTGVSVALAATDVDGEALTYTVSTLPAAETGAASVAGAVATFVPALNYNGSAAFIVTASDGLGGTASQTINVSVSAVDDAIDVADDNQATTYTAISGAVDVFTDNSDQKTNAIIENMTSEDSLVVSGAAADYSFTSVGSDIQITYNNTTAGVVNVIVLKGLAGTAFINSEAEAEAAAGWNFFRALTQPSGSGGDGGSEAGAGGNLDTDNDANALTQATVAATGANSFTEDANVANYVKITGFGSDDTITVSNALTSAYSFTSVGTDIKITYTTSGGVVNDITLVGVLSGATFIESEADAEAALGFNFFRNVESSSTSSLDVGTASSTATVSGANAAVEFTDDATRNSYVRITDFAAGDSIRVTGANEGDYNFSSLDLDGDGSADDLSITSNTGSGVVNDIQILNVVSSSAFVLDKASAVSAVGFNFITFG